MTLKVGDCFKTKDHTNYSGYHFKITETMGNWYRGIYAEWADPDLQNTRMGPYSEKDLIPISKKAWTTVRNDAIQARKIQDSYFISPNASEEEIEEKQGIQNTLKKEVVKKSRSSKRTTKKTTAKKTTAKKAPLTTKDVKRKPRGLAALKAREESQKNKSGSSQNAINDAIKSMTVASQEKTKQKSRRKTKKDSSESSLENFI